MASEGSTEVLRVLVIDDEAPVRTLVRLALERSGVAEVIAEADGSPDRVIAGCLEQPDVVLLDQHLDGLLGTELIGEITRVCPRAMIAVLTALDAETEEASALVAGAFVFYEKAMITSSLATFLVEDHRLFRDALAGQDVYAPSALARRAG